MLANASGRCPRCAAELNAHAVLGHEADCALQDTRLLPALKRAKRSGARVDEAIVLVAVPPDSPIARLKALTRDRDDRRP
jgi:hypothetical protein